MEKLKKSENILVIDDEEEIRNICKNTLQAPDITVYTARDISEAMDYLSKINFGLVLADSKLPGMSNEALPMAIKSISHTTDVIITIGHSPIEEEINNLKTKATGFLIKPFDTVILKTTVYKYLSRKEEKEEAERKELFIENIKNELKDIIAFRAELVDTTLDTILHLTIAAEHHDSFLGRHLQRISAYSTLLASELGFSEERSKMIGFASMMHDIGKIGISDTILMKPDKLTLEEFEEVKKHPLIGSQFLKGFRQELLRMASLIVLTHHEKFDGTGYPYLLTGESIPISGRIVAISDVFDALISRRVYKPPIPIEGAIEIMEKDSKRHFDPLILKCFLNSIDKIQKIIEEIGIEK